MKIVNKSGIPESLFSYLSMDGYDYDAKGTSFSCTELLNPPQIVILKRRHWNEIEVDGIDRLWQMLGNGVHAILEKEKGIEKIERLKVEVLGRTVSGKWDRIKDNKITDYKVTSAWTVAYGSRNKEWGEQLSIYRWLYFKNKGILLDSKGYIVALLRDWDSKKVGGKYPKAPALEISLDLMSIEDTEKFVEKKIKAILEAEKTLPECTDEERWYNGKTKSYMRCARYCEVSKFCPQYQKELNKKNIEEADEALLEEMA